MNTTTRLNAVMTALCLIMAIVVLLIAMHMASFTYLVFALLFGWMAWTFFTGDDDDNTPSVRTYLRSKMA